MHTPLTSNRSSSHQRRYRRRCPAAVRYTLLAPPARLTVDEAAALLRLPRRAVETDMEWPAPAAGDVSDGVIVRERPALYS